ncbi:DsbA family oxidoreductase [Herbaspirillum seropedicae]|uniref:DsbA family oxidoreductase n=1 Tax=Herbaspirillum seropedicae TaxID=964 RepID=UPI000863AADD|nr:DsbA family protein [Herbaspirillum seropedicae]AON52873.1 dithiol-disulfide isomerase involved in polyketide biosynthesis protein [Herbaspirillum seropedicae]MDR6397093.1 putative DsbA family dithiol-disulfide isomerase [Herbaspirillum seropedicae]
MLRIDLYTEITCPWCFVGQHRLDKVLRERFAELTADIHHHPVLLLPDAPATGLYIPDLLRTRYGVTDPKSAFSRPESEARASGFHLDLSRQRYAYPTQAAHAIILAARERRTQHQLAIAITDAYFIDAKNISDVDVLADLAADHGFSADEARAIALDPIQHKRIEQQAANSKAVGVNSVPHFVFGSNSALNGACSEGEIAHVIGKTLHAVTGGR